MDDSLRLLNVAEVAKMLNVSGTWVRDHAAGGGRRSRMGGTLRFRPEAVTNFVREMEQIYLMQK